MGFSGQKNHKLIQIVDIYLIQPNWIWISFKDPGATGFGHFWIHPRCQLQDLWRVFHLCAQKPWQKTWVSVIWMHGLDLWQTWNNLEYKGWFYRCILRICWTLCSNGFFGFQSYSTGYVERTVNSDESIPGETVELLFLLTFTAHPEFRVPKQLGSVAGPWVLSSSPETEKPVDWKYDIIG